MRKILFLSLLFVATTSFSQVTYYLSASGDDANSGTSAAAPWKTISKLNSMMNTIVAGDTIRFKRGDAFVGEILPVNSGTASAKIVYDAYGTGDAPVINAAAVISNWTVHSSNIWVADYTGTLASLNNFFINDASQQIGRFPNADSANEGYRRIQRGTGNSLLIDNQLMGQNWTGATAVVRVNLFLLQRPTIQLHRNDSLTFVSPGVGNYTINTGYGYFIQNHIGTLDQQGEWYFDRTAKKLYIYSSSDPNNLKTEVPVAANCFFASGISHFSIQNLAFRNSNENAIRIDSTAGMTTTGIDITNCSFENNHNAILVNRASVVNISNNFITNTNNNAIFITARNYQVTGNTITRTALRAGMGEQANNQYNAINFVGSDAIAANNIIDSVGYCGIRFEGSRLKVMNNQVSRFAMVKADVGGIYTFKGFAPTVYGYGNNEITGNIIRDAYPNIYGVNSGAVNSNYSCGIYMDNSSSGNLIEGNTVYNIMSAGLMMNITTSNHTVRNNTFFNNQYGFGYFPDNTTTSKNHRIISNIFYQKQLFQQGGLVQTGNKTFMTTIGTIDSNYYRHPFEEDSAFVQTSSTSFTPRITDGLAIGNWRKLGYDENGSYESNYKAPVTVTAIGANRITNSNNSQFTTGLTVGTTAYTLTPASGTNRPTWDNHNVLDGGSMMLDLADTAVSKSSRAHITIGTLNFGKYYRLKFSMKGNTDTAYLNIAILANASSTFGVTKFKSVPVSTNRKEVELLLSPYYDNNNTILAFTLNTPANKIWLDNIQFNELTVTENDPGDFVRFEVNNTATPKDVDLGSDVYKDVKGNSYFGTATIAPFSSLILEKQDPSTLPVSITSFTGTTEDCATKLQWTITGEKSIKHYEVEQSLSGTAFKQVAVIKAGVGAGGAYKATCKQPTRAAYYRLKMVDNDGSYAYSTVIKVQNSCIGGESMHAYPNPVKDVLNISYNALLAGKAMLTVIDVHGKTMLMDSKWLQSGMNNLFINASSLPAGTYLLRVVTEHSSLTSTFIK
ncbi:T9SS type A sorting domain-containing protein [Aridibaculum aurantiacum]|uniref:T9SS type A sorting domain-containing protein n=1 Tax=Aridibaculum aurantiacum TaxID=2810307 RepID=UPI001A961882|nr:T9SS type A sorting domain-containing protein [Aridibaculum aurantiacum]